MNNAIGVDGAIGKGNLRVGKNLGQDDFRVYKIDGRTGICDLRIINQGKPLAV